jgi:hypothetical protein
LVQLLDEQGASETREFMEQYWINNKFQTEEFWEVRLEAKLYLLG